MRTRILTPLMALAVILSATACELPTELKPADLDLTCVAEGFEGGPPSKQCSN